MGVHDISHQSNKRSSTSKASCREGAVSGITCRTIDLAVDCIMPSRCDGAPTDGGSDVRDEDGSVRN